MFSRLGRRIATRSFNTSSRRLGGGGHHHDAHAHKPLGPYEVPHHATYPNEAYLFGINPNVKYQSEGWEWVTLATYIIGAGIMIAGATTKELDSFKVRIFYFYFFPRIRCAFLLFLLLHLSTTKEILVFY